MTQEPPVPADAHRQRRQRVSARLTNPFAWGFAATAGGLVAIVLGGAMATLSTVFISIGVALFIAMALEPVVTWLTGDRLSRGAAITVVFLTFALVAVILLALIIPTAGSQVMAFTQRIPDHVAAIQESRWFQDLVVASGQGEVYADLLERARRWVSDPGNLLALGGGALAVGSGVVNGISGTLIVLVLTLYFLASMPTMKSALTRLAPAYARPRVSTMTEQVTASVGNYVSGMVVLAVANSVVSLVLLMALGVPFAPMLAVLALFVTMIPMVGSVVFWIVASLVALLTTGWLGLVFVGVYFTYMQVEAYALTPRVMSRTVRIPGSLVLIGAMVGGTLLGLLGALVAVPVTASALMVVREVVVPRQDARTHPDL